MVHLYISNLFKYFRLILILRWVGYRLGTSLSFKTAHFEISNGSKKINEEVKEWFSLFFGNDLTHSGYDVPKMNYRAGGGSDSCDISLVVKQ